MLSPQDNVKRGEGCAGIIILICRNSESNLPRSHPASQSFQSAHIPHPLYSGTRDRASFKLKVFLLWILLWIKRLCKHSRVLLGYSDFYTKSLYRHVEAACSSWVVLCFSLKELIFLNSTLSLHLHGKPFMKYEILSPFYYNALTDFEPILSS